MVVPIVFFLVLYLLAVGFFLIGSLFVIYHAIRFGQASRVNTITMSLYLIVAVFIIGLSLWYASAIDWSTRIDIIDAFELFFL